MLYADLDFAPSGEQLAAQPQPQRLIWKQLVTFRLFDQCCESAFGDLPFAAPKGDGHLPRKCGTIRNGMVERLDLGDCFVHHRESLVRVSTKPKPPRDGIERQHPLIDSEAKHVHLATLGKLLQSVFPPSMRPGMLAHEMVENPRHPFRVRLALCVVQTCGDGLSAFRES